ncbi:hypothetical protein [Microlunatus parietis]|uniref:Uncharacterized protein n=1 Tax=Microlunatus parietis TaxID=682979 RepID=A0A7Y9I9I6_9ACTN|nr:hypothetical protein [Microlunatus parietis]NYE72813.1 hypothetical protein [Microlunatus parietis]
MSELEPHRTDADGQEIRADGPVIVVTAMSLTAEARDALAAQLGPGHVVRDIRDAGSTADLVLVPPVSRRLIGGLKALFPGARVLIAEFSDPRFGADFAGPVARSVAAGADGYFVAPSLDELASITYEAAQGRPIAGVLTGGPEEQAHELPAAGPPDAGPGSPVIMIDLTAWPDDEVFRRFAGTIVDQLRDQGIAVVLRTAEQD